MVPKQERASAQVTMPMSSGSQLLVPTSSYKTAPASIGYRTQERRGTVVPCPGSRRRSSGGTKAVGRVSMQLTARLRPRRFTRSWDSEAARSNSRSPQTSLPTLARSNSRPSTYTLTWCSKTTAVATSYRRRSGFVVSGPRKHPRRSSLDSTTTSRSLAAVRRRGTGSRSATGQPGIFRFRTRAARLSRAARQRPHCYIGCASTATSLGLRRPLV